MKKITSIIQIIFTFIFSLLGFSIIWCLSTWTRLSMDELVYELSAPLRGVGSDMLANFFIKCFAPAVAVTVIALVLSLRLKDKVKDRIKPIALLVAFGFAAVTTAVFWKTLDVTDYLKNLRDESAFIEDNYVDPAATTITFPEQKRNLIYIYLESMETTYADRESGGGFEENCIPELTELAKEGEDFSADNTDILNGAMVPYGTTWTMGAMFAQSSGLPLKISVGNNNMSEQQNFFPGVTTIGDILSKEGYNQELLIGSDAGFGGRLNFYQSHGNYNIHDYVYAGKMGIIPSDYKVFWGYEDEKLFENAKNDLKELSSKDEPFNLTLLTVDTHFPDGYVCHLCRDEFPGNQYANVMACSSRQVSDFVHWIQQQDFYENTTVVVCGDHTTMNEDFCRDIPDGYVRRTYTAIFNSAVSKVRADEDIQYSTLDMFPTTLAALGAQIEGEQLGLGVNLLSGEKTLVEKHGFDEVNSQFKKTSAFMDSLSGIEVDEETMLQNGWLPNADVNVIEYDRSSDSITVRVDSIVNAGDVKKVYATTYDQDMNKISRIKLKLMPDRSYQCSIKLSELPDKTGTVTITASGEDDIEVGTLKGYLPLHAHESLETYAELLKQYENKAVIMASKGSFKNTALGSYFNVIRDIGVATKFSKEDGLNLYGVVDNPSIYYETDSNPLSVDGVLIGNELPIHIESSQDDASIMIDGTEYASDRDGLNIVVYDYDAERVIDSVCFNLSYEDRYHARANIGTSFEGSKVTITATDVFALEMYTHEDVTVSGAMWDGKHYKKPMEFVFTCDDTDTFTAELDTKGYDLSDIYLELSMYYDKTKLDYKILDWHGDIHLLKGTFEEYLGNIQKATSDYVLILSTKDDSVRELDEASKQALKELGLDRFLETEEFCCSYAIITPNEVKEDCGPEDLYYEGSIKDDTVILSNSGWYGAYYSSVEVNGREYSRNENGINLVLYDTKLGEVVDTLTYVYDAQNEKAYRIER